MGKGGRGDRPDLQTRLQLCSSGQCVFPSVAATLQTLWLVQEKEPPTQCAWGEESVYLTIHSDCQEGCFSSLQQKCEPEGEPARSALASLADAHMSFLG